MAVKWKEWEADGDDYDLQYRTAGDNRVREEHAALNKTTLPFSDPFWDHFLPQNGWNCRCTTVQVRKGKYKQSNSEEAIAIGNACTQGVKQQIFRFNPGKEMKVFPPKHPYLPKGCNGCPYKGSINLSTPVDRPLQMCTACGVLIKQCLANNKSEINAWKENAIDEKKGLSIDGDNFKSGSMLITRNSVRQSLNHTMNMAVRNSILSIEKNALKWDYCGWADCKVDKKIGVKKHPESDYFLYYKTTIGGVDYYANVKANKDRRREELYCIRDKSNTKINKGNPPNIERYKSK